MVRKEKKNCSAGKRNVFFLLFLPSDRKCHRITELSLPSNVCASFHSPSTWTIGGDSEFVGTHDQSHHTPKKKMKPQLTTRPLEKYDAVAKSTMKIARSMEKKIRKLWKITSEHNALIKYIIDLLLTSSLLHGKRGVLFLYIFFLFVFVRFFLSDDRKSW